VRDTAKPFLITTCVAFVLSTFCPTSKERERERGRGREGEKKSELRDGKEQRTEEDRKDSNIYKYIYIIYLRNLYFWHGILGQNSDSWTHGFVEEGATLCK
jgi:hypothetical protein